MASSTEPNTSPKSRPSNAYLKYSGLALQLLAAIGFFGWLGYLLDQHFQFQFPLFMLLLGFGAFGGMMFQVYRAVKQ